MFIFTGFFCFSANAQNVGAVVDVKLSPAGSFKGETSKVTGSAQKTADGVTAENIEVDLTSLKTGVDLRDKHTKERLMVDKHPKAKLIKAEGKGGKGKATIEIKGIQKEVTGTYKIAGNMLQAQFKMLLSDLDIKNVRYMGVGAKDEVIISVTVPIK
ncbi:MAG: YceI family protein [Bdellovibrionaceae bacterium]|nr:YceI family protein [Pseudobdellovibrionaceae bacterium]